MTENQEILTGVFKSVFGLDEIDETISVVSFEPWDSMAHITLILEMEKQFETSFSTDEVIELTSVPAILDILSHRAKN
jgi:acyl carrier protein